MRTRTLRCQGLTKWYGQTLAVAQLDLAVGQGKTLALLGPSGCGKTTVLRLIAGFEEPDAGWVEVGGVTVADRGVLLPPEQRRVGMVFQDYALFPHLSVAGNVGFGVPGGPSRQTRVREVLELVGLTGMERRMPHELSGGQQQRVALARALAPRPEVLLLDEPFSNLDAALRSQVRQEVRDILVTSGTTAIFVTHDQEEALLMGDTVAVLKEGRLEQVDTPEAIYHAPATKFVASFMGIADFVSAEYANGALWTELGTVTWLADAPPSGRLEVMVRPDDLVLTSLESGPGRVTSRTFQGAFFLYEVVLDSGVPVRCLQPHSAQPLPIGARVQARLRLDHEPPCFLDGKLYSRPRLSVPSTHP